MPKLELSDRGIKAAKVSAGERKLDLFDTLAKGLALRIGSGGSKVFFHVYSDAAGKRVWHRIGEYPEPITLAAAREASRSLRGQVQGGKDPAVEKRAHDASQTVSDLVESYLARAVASRRSVNEIARRLRRNVSGRDKDGKAIEGASAGCIGDIKLNELHRRDLTKAIDAIVDRGAGTEANRVYEDVRAMVRWARGRGDLDENLTEGMTKPTVTAPRDRWLTEAEIAAVWQALPDADMSEGSRRILKLCLLLGQRVGEVAGMNTPELDLDAGAWTLPSARTKNGQQHVVPLPTMAVTIIREQLADVAALAKRKQREVPAEVFPAPGFRGAVAAMSVPKALKRLEVDGMVLGVPSFTPHDLRRTAATGMEGLGISPHVIGHVLNHVSVTKASITSSVYARYDYSKEKSDALDLWAARLEAITAGKAAKILPMKMA